MMLLKRTKKEHRNETMGRKKKTENVVQEKGHEMSKVDTYLTI